MVTSHHETGSQALLPRRTSWPAPPPRQLPPDPDPFVGRDAELATLDEWRDTASGPLLAVISGPDGIGKTALALRWSHRRRTHFPDGRLFVEGHGPCPDTPRPAAELLGSLLCSLGVPPDGIPPEVGERLRRYHCLTEGRSLVVLVDNAASSAQVRPLLPRSSGSALVVTSTERLSGLAREGARFLEPSPLDERDSLRLLSGVLGQHPLWERPGAPSEQAVPGCGLPLALAVLAGWPDEEPPWDAEERRPALPHAEGNHSVSEVRRAEHHLTAVLDLRHRRLSAGAAALHRILSRHPGTDLPAELVRHLAELTGIDHAPALEELVRAHLFEHTGERYRFHERVLAHTRATDEHAATAGNRTETLWHIVCWYLARATEADLVLTPRRRRFGPSRVPNSRNPERFGAPEALAWFDREHANLTAVLHAAYRRGWQQQVWQLCEALGGFLDHRRYHRARIATHRIGVAAANGAGHSRAEARLRCHLGAVHLELGHFRRVLDVCTPALRLAESAFDRAGISTALSHLAEAAHGSGDRELALHYVRRALRLNENTGDRHGIALCHRRIGVLLSETGHYAEAATSLDRALTLLNELGEHRGRAGVLIERGRLHLRRGEFVGAESCLTEALAAARESGSSISQVEALDELGELAALRGDPAAALRHRSRAEQQRRASSPPAAERRHAGGEQFTRAPADTSLPSGRTYD
ncbi:tetratricopeptide repeat protein [Actinopolyspora mortivallis]|uniref:NB-ARC domain-containing protein n=1 Tax=Actinopolyspora mortivallis TaxID=33906 RepID=A0A2T0GS44_ACTMO|nr:tetratricopeptide repeat protein [Actinopolyspora mortivallis]PRW61938.1 hypothetical protein CEP50_17990 [Actinopolyspora mortivallis]